MDIDSGRFTAKIVCSISVVQGLAKNIVYWCIADVFPATAAHSLASSLSYDI